MPKDSILRIHGKERFRLRWSNDDWHSQHDTESTVNNLQIDFVDLPAAVSSSDKGASFRFTFFWLDSNSWEGRDYEVGVR
jgi:glucoamylase